MSVDSIEGAVGAGGGISSAGLFFAGFESAGFGAFFLFPSERFVFRAFALPSKSLAACLRAARAAFLACLKAFRAALNFAFAVRARLRAASALISAATAREINKRASAAFLPFAFPVSTDFIIADSQPPPLILLTRPAPYRKEANFVRL